MPDRLPPTDGSVPYDERDLDALLSGEAPSVPDPLARAVAALRAAPAAAELDGEAAARAAFRLFVLPDENRPAWTDHPGANGAATLMLPGGPADDGLWLLVPPPRRRRRAPWRGPWQALALTGTAAAAALIVGVAALAGAFSGPAGRPGSTGPRSGTRPPVAASSARQTSPVLEGGATREATAHPTPTAAAGAGAGAAASPEELCGQYFASGGAPGYSVTRQLTELAGGAWNIDSYCDEELGIAQPAPPGPGPGNPGGGFGHPPGRGGGPGGPGPGHHGFGSSGGRRG